MTKKNPKTKSWLGDVSDSLDVDQLANLLGVKPLNDIDYESGNYGYFIDMFKREALDDGMSEDDAQSYAEEKAQAEEQAEVDKAFLEYKDAIDHVAEKLFNEHGLDLTWNAKKFVYKIAPQKDWKDAADKIRMTINGVGRFEFSSLKEFLDSGPYTAREAVLSHLGWIPQWIAVYEGGTAAGMVDRRMRNPGTQKNGAARSKGSESNPREPQGDWLLIRSKGLDDEVLSAHKTKGAAEKAMRKHGGEPDSLFQSGMHVVERSRVEVIPRLQGGWTTRTRTNPQSVQTKSLANPKAKLQRMRNPY